jgi:hypothetical protein
MTRPLYEIMKDIREDYAAQGKPVHPWAAPYVDSLSNLTHMSDVDIAETGYQMVPYLLNNLKTWRGEKAREIKAELRAMLDKK